MADQSITDSTAEEAVDTPAPIEDAVDAPTPADDAAPAEGTAPTPAAPPAPAPEASGPQARANRRKVREGLVVSTKMDKTAVVAIVERVRHRRYARTMQVTSHLYAHDEQNEAREGDRVRVQETRPMSKLKRWRIVEVLERAR